MANKASLVEPLVSGAAVKGTAKTATFTTDGFSLHSNGKRLNLFLDLTVTGTTPTMTGAWEVTQDGTTYAAMPAAANSETQADTVQLTATGANSKWWEVGIPFGDDTANYKARLVFTIGGTNPSFTFNEIKVTLID